jgi:hypothetical protein
MLLSGITLFSCSKMVNEQAPDECMLWNIYRNESVSTNKAIFSDFGSIQDGASDSNQGSITNFTAVQHNLHIIC